MANYQQRYESGIAPSLRSGVSILEMILPTQAIPLLLLLLIVAPIVLLTAESLIIPLFEWMRNRMVVTGDVPLPELPTYFFIKLITFLILSFLGGFQLLLRIKAIYYTTWAKAFPRPHSLHCDYQTDASTGMVALVQWKLYQVAMILVPPIVMTAITFLVGLVELYLFNTFSDLSFVGLSIQLTIELFLIMMLGLFTVFAFLHSIWTSLTSLFGDVVAVTEPDLPNPLVMQRCGRIAFASSYVYILLPIFFLFVAAVLGEVAWLLMEVDIHQFISFKANVPLILLMEVVTLAWYLGFNFFQFYTYHHGLMNYYTKLPPQLKECFSAPPARHNNDGPSHYSPAMQS